MNFKYIPEIDDLERYAWLRMQLILQNPGYNVCIQEQGLSYLTYQTYEDLWVYAQANSIQPSVAFESAWYSSMRNNVELYTRFGEELDLDWINPNKTKYIKLLRCMSENKKIHAIKTMRQIWSIGLKDSKYYCDDVMDKPETLNKLRNELKALSETHPEYAL